MLVLNGSRQGLTTDVGQVQNALSGDEAVGTRSELKSCGDQSLVFYIESGFAHSLFVCTVVLVSLW